VIWGGDLRGDLWDARGMPRRCPGDARGDDRGYARGVNWWIHGGCPGDARGDAMPGG
jgi:hypothetical protein